jgi:F0F1-type ATP synthase membrane subunit b/b'
MSNATEAADFLKRQVALLRGFEQAAEALDRIGSMELAAKEAQNARKQAEAECAEAVEQLTGIKEEIKFSEGKAAEIISQARAEATESASEIIDAAKTEAQRITDSATTNAMHAQAAADSDMALTTARLGAMKTELDDVTSAISEGKNAYANLLSEHSKLSDSLAKLKAKFA